MWCVCVCALWHGQQRNTFLFRSHKTHLISPQRKIHQIQFDQQVIAYTYVIIVCRGMFSFFERHRFEKLFFFRVQSVHNLVNKNSQSEIDCIIRLNAYWFFILSTQSTLHPLSVYALASLKIILIPGIVGPCASVGIHTTQSKFQQHIQLVIFDCSILFFSVHVHVQYAWRVRLWYNI